MLHYCLLAIYHFWESLGIISACRYLLILNFVFISIPINMYAVIEFPRKQCSIVPYSWLTNDEKHCNWPINVTQTLFDKYVLDKKEPLKSWRKFEVVKILFLSSEYDQAESKLKNTLEENTTASSDAGENIHQLILKTVDPLEDEQNSDKENIDNNDDLLSEEENGELENKSASKKRKVYEETREISDFDSSNEDIATSPKFRKDKASAASKKKRQKPFQKQIDDFSDSFSDESNKNDSRPSSSKSTSSKQRIQNSPSTSIVITTQDEHSGQGVLDSLEHSKFGKLLLTKMENIIATQSQQCILLDQLAKTQSATAVQQLITPANLPNMPIASKADYRDLQMFLAKENNFTYLKCRLATIGGSSVRYVIMGMLKFMLSNEIAMKFNWAGQNNKKAFKSTKMMEVIREAVKYHYRGRDDVNDLTDKEIDSAVKDWLKLAKARKSYSSRKD